MVKRRVDGLPEMAREHRGAQLSRSKTNTGKEQKL